MMAFARYFYTGLAAGLLSGLAAFFYARIYTEAVDVSYPGIVSTQGIFSVCIFVSMLIALAYWAIKRLFRKDAELLFNILLLLCCSLSIVIPFIVSLPLDMPAPELFPGLIAPMHFCVALSWYTVKPIFFK
jgi:hypothetical protein